MTLDGQDISGNLQPDGSFTVPQVNRGDHVLSLQVSGCQGNTITFSVRQRYGGRRQYGAHGADGSGRAKGTGSGRPSLARAAVSRYAVASEHSLPSPLSHFDSADLLNALSTGIILLDAQLCPIYANVAAQDLLAISLNQSRGRPFGDHLVDSNGLIPILRRSIETGEAFADRELVLNLKSTPREPRIVDVTITPLEGEVTGTHLLLELTDTTARQRISRENDMLVRLDSSRMMLRQLAHEIKNPLGRPARRGAAAGARAAERGAQGIHQRHHFRGRSPERARRVDDRPEPPDAEDAAEHP